MVKTCGTPEDFCWEYVTGAAGFEEQFRRMREYVKCINKVERDYKKTHKQT